MLDFESYSELISDHHADSLAMARRLQSLNVPMLSGRAARMLACNKSVAGMYCHRCKRFHTTNAHLCRDRLCPNCGWSLARSRSSAAFKAFSALVEVLDASVLSIVLTMQHDDLTQGLDDALDLLQSSLSRFMKLKKVRAHMLGAISSIEIANEDHGLHPHVHLLYAVDSDYYQDIIKQSELCVMWQRCLHADYIPVTYIRVAYSSLGSNDLKKAVYECTKYNIKTADWLHMPDETLQTAAAAIHGRHFFTVYGKNFRRQFAALAAESEHEEVPKLCDKCGDMLKSIVYNTDNREVIDI